MVHVIKREHSSLSYVGETGRNLDRDRYQRLKEYLKEKMKEYVLEIHSWEENYGMNFDIHNNFQNKYEEMKYQYTLYPQWLGFWNKSFSNIDKIIID